MAFDKGWYNNVPGITEEGKQAKIWDAKEGGYVGLRSVDEIKELNWSTKTIGFKACPYCILVIFSPSLPGSKPHFGNSSERTAIVAFCFQLFNFGLFPGVRVNALSKKPMTFLCNMLFYMINKGHGIVINLI